MSYTPKQKILDKYADVLINFALNSGKGVRPQEVVLLQVPENAKPMLISLRRAVIKSGAHPIIQYLPDDIAKDFYDLAQDHHLDFFPSKYLKGIVDQIDHSVAILADTDPHELSKVDPKKIMRRSNAMKPYKDWRFAKEAKGKFTWTLALYATPAMAAEAGLSERSYWNQIIKACYLDEEDPIARWKSSAKEIDRVKNKLTKLNIQSLHIKAKDTDLNIAIGDNRKWLDGSGRNIPSFEVFISPNWKWTEGHVRFTEKLYIYGNLVEDVYLEFQKGVVTKVSAKKGQKVLEEMIKLKNGNKVGEFSLTDSRLSRITKFMANTLYDENIGGKYGNMHLALGSAYHDSYPGDQTKVKKSAWQGMGYNDSIVHTDIVATSDRVVTATLKDGTEKIIYKNGKFTI
jgi:aminopeptidase